MLPMPGARTLPCRPQGPSLAPRPGASPCLGKLLPEERCRATVCPGGSQPSCRTQRAHSPHAWSCDLSARRDRCWASPSRGHLGGAGGRRALERGEGPPSLRATATGGHGYPDRAPTRDSDKLRLCLGKSTVAERRPRAWSPGVLSTVHMRDGVTSANPVAGPAARAERRRGTPQDVLRDQ